MLDQWTSRFTVRYFDAETPRPRNRVAASIILHKSRRALPHPTASLQPGLGRRARVQRLARGPNRTDAPADRSLQAGKLAAVPLSI